jgi:hypothetical protein
MTLDELDDSLPNGFHDAQRFSLELNYVAGSAKFTGLCFCSIGPPQSNYPFIPDGEPINLSGDSVKPDHLQSLPDLDKKCHADTWYHRFFLMIGMSLFILPGAMQRLLG